MPRRDPSKSTEEVRRKVEGANLVEVKPKRIVLDWRAYFVEFCKVHGEPVEDKGRLLFRDGWGYSMTAYEGPEYPPPLDPDELDRVVVQYWLRRRRQVTESIGHVQSQLKAIQQQQVARSLPLQQVTIVQDGEKVKRAYTKVDTTALETRLKWLRNDLTECDVRLREIEDFHKQQAQQGRVAS